MTTRATRSPRRRTVVALGFVLIVLVAFVVRLVDIQVVNASEYVTQSQAYATGESITLTGTRGEIVDTNGEVLATSTVLYDVQVDPYLAIQGVVQRDAAGAIVRDENGEKVITAWPELAAQIAAITGQDADEVTAIVEDAIAADPGDRFEYIKRYVSTEVYRELATLGFSFLTFPATESRTYPDGAVAGNVIGFLSGDGEDALEGLESLQNACLEPSDGTLTYQKGKDGVVIPGTEVESAATDGGTLQLTIDVDLQWYMQQLVAEQVDRYEADWGGIIVMEVATGKIRAFAETPTVDPNDPSASDSDDRASRLMRFSFEPGSTFKPITAATVIEEGAATPLTTVETPSRMRFSNGAVVNDSEGHATQNLTLNGGLVTSSNVAMSQFGAMVDPQTRYDYLTQFGVGGGTALNWAGEPSGGFSLQPQDWDAQTYYATTFGQGFTVTSTQVASVYQTIANGGVRLPAQLVESCTTADGEVITPELDDPVEVISEDTAAEVTQMLENVYAQATLADDIHIPGYRLAVKTGTAQIINDAGTAYKQGLYFTSLVGFAPADDPQYVVLTVFDEPKTQTMSSANRSVFKKAMTQVLTHYRIMPSDEETPLLPVTG